MLRAIRQSKLASAVLSALIVLGMWSNAMAAAFCPHMMGKSDCLMQPLRDHSHHRVGDSSPSMSHAHMADMDMHDMDMADTQMDDATASQPKLDAEFLSYHAPEGAPNKDLTDEAITQPNEPCSHCMMHSRSGANAPLRVVLNLSNNAEHVIAADSAMGIVQSLPSALTFLDLHDHSPPGSSAPLYILVSAFRI